MLFRGLNTTASGSDLAVQRDVIFERAHRLALDVYRPRDASKTGVTISALAELV